MRARRRRSRRARPLRAAARRTPRAAGLRAAAPPWPSRVAATTRPPPRVVPAGGVYGWKQQGKMQVTSYSQGMRQALWEAFGGARGRSEEEEPAPPWASLLGPRLRPAPALCLRHGAPSLPAPVGP